jgi:hypothetical protein
MTVPIEELWSMPEPVLIDAYHGARRQSVEKKFARDTQRAQLESAPKKDRIERDRAGWIDMVSLLRIGNCLPWPFQKPG